MAARKKDTTHTIHAVDLRSDHSDELHRELFARYNVSRQAKRDLEKARRIQKKRNPIVRTVGTFFHAIGWTIRLFLPPFIVEHPSFSDAVRILSRNPQFRHFRTLFVSWVIFTVLAGSTGYYFYKTTSSAEADVTVSMQTGYYVGTGATQSITGLGFTPQLVIIKSDTSAGSAIWKSSAMPATEYSYWGAATADNTENQITLDTDGFTVQTNSDVNTLNIRYIWIAFTGNNCTSSGSFCIGSYNGNSGTTQDIATGFQPDLVWAKRATATTGYFRTSAMATNNASSLVNAADDTTGLFTTLNSTSFTVGGLNNTNGGTYYFAAFKAGANFLSVGSYTGDGTTGRSIIGVGFTPTVVLTKANSTSFATFNSTQSWGDYSSLTVGANIVAAIQKLQSDGFLVGASANANANGTPYKYFAFKSTASTSSPIGSFTLRRGSYVGTGTAMTVNGIGFKPDLVFIKTDTTGDWGLFSTSLDNNETYYSANSTGLNAGWITAMTSDGFSIGASTLVNTNGITYEYVAFGNATAPGRPPAASDFVIGTYTGNSIDGRVIDNLAIHPDLVFVKGSSAAPTLGAFQTSSMAANTTAFLSPTADDTTGGYIKTLNADGFTLGTSANAAGTTYRFIAFQKGATTFNVGSYSGSGVAKDITGIGFQPDLVWDKVTTNTRAVHRSSSSTITGTNSQVFANGANIANAITGFVSDGFSVGTAAEVNTNAASYRWVAWKAPPATSAPSTPTNTTPAAAATSVDLNAPLTASAYSDPGSNQQTGAQWQVDDNSDFSSPEWTRTAGTAEAATQVTSVNGTFANDLAGKTELVHSTLYYFRVRYSNGLYSSWSTATPFTTNAIAAPSNTTPADGATVTTLTPSLTASAFSDPQTGHTGTSAEWQLDKTSAFSAPIYDSGEVAYSTSFAVPNAILSNQTTYYFRVRYKDSGGQWSAYSTPTRFLVAQSSLTVKPLFSNTVVDQGDSINIDAQIALDDGTVISDAAPTISIYNPSGTKIVTNASMTTISGSNGVYRYTYTVPASNGSYLYEVSVTKDSAHGYGAGNFQVKTISASLSGISSTTSSTNSTVNTINTTTSSTNSTVGTINSNVSSVASTTAATNAAVNTINSNVNSLVTSMAGVVSQIGVGNIAAIRTKTDSINWGDVTGIVTTSGAIKTKTDTIDWNDVSAIKTKTDTIDWTDITGVKSKTDTINWIDVTNTASAVNDVSTKVDTVSNTVSDVSSAVNSLANNLDVLVGALIVTQSSVDDSSPSASAFTTTLANDTDDFYKNAVLTFTSGELKGQSRRISHYDALSKEVDVNPALSAAPSNGDLFTIVAQNVRSEEVADDLSQTEADTNTKVTDTNSKVTDTNTKVTDIQTKVNSIATTLQSLDTKLDTLQSSINTVRSSQQSLYGIDFSDSKTVMTGGSYKATLTLTDYESAPADATDRPTVTIYDASRNAVVLAVPMTRNSTGVYDYSYSVPGSSTSGLWESVVTIPFGSSTQTRTSYWTVNGSPAQVKINSFSSLTVPTITANVTITNEGNASNEYQYQYCVVSNQTDACTSPSVVASASGAKLINPGDDFTTDLSLTVPNPGNYWFKLLVTFNGQTSSASRSFAGASSSGNSGNGSTGSGGGSASGTVSGGGVIVNAQSLDDIRNQLQANSLKLQTMLTTIGAVDPTTPGFKSLLDISLENTASIKDIQNKMTELKAISATLHAISQNGTDSPTIQTYMKFNSVELYFLITNPSTETKTAQFSAPLPEEVTPDDVENSDGLTVAYDATQKSYVVSGSIDVSPGQSITKKVEVKDIWVFDPKTLSDLEAQAHTIATSLVKTQYGSQATLTENDLKSALNTIRTAQAASYDSPENHIVVYRQNKVLFDQANADLAKLKDLLTQSGASQGLLGNIGGIQTFATWGIILAMVLGFALLAAVIFALWRHQLSLTAAALRIQNATAPTPALAGGVSSISAIEPASKARRKHRKKRTVADEWHYE